jgi:phosphoribosylamine--glycine ligase
VDAGYGLVVPQYVADAGVKSLADLGAHKDKFGGKIYGIEAGNDGNRIIGEMIAKKENKLEGFELVESSEAGMLTQAEKAMKNNEWIIFLGWTPHPVMGEMKIAYLDGMGDTGLNTGGMGAVSPVPFADAAFMEKVVDSVIKPTIRGLHEEAIDYKGFVFFGLIKVGDEPFVIEYNCRLGDPETEVVIPRMETDLVGLCVAACNKELHMVKVRADERAVATIVAVSKGYPGFFEKGFEITGLDGKYGKQSIVFQAGTKEKDGKVVTNGGRVCCVTSYGSSIEEAVNTSLDVMSYIEFDGMYYRSDIGYEFMSSPKKV